MKTGNRVKSDSSRREDGSSGVYVPNFFTNVITLRSIHRITSFTCGRPERSRWGMGMAQP